MIYFLKIRRRLSDHSVTEEKGKKIFDMTIVIDNVMYLTCMFLGMIVIKCDFKNDANQKKQSGASLGEEQGQGKFQLPEAPVLEKHLFP